MKRIALAMIAALVMLASVAPRAQDAERLFKAAMNVELVDGNLPSAIEQYKKVVQSGNRTLAAQALVRMAECYQKLGDVQAKTIYEQVLRDYADQNESTSIARARLGEGRPAAVKSMALRKVWSGPNISSEECGVSSDGRYVTCPAWETGDLGLHDLTTGADRLLTTNNWAGNQYAQGSAISKDGAQVAYAWFNGKRYELRLTSLRGPDAGPRTILDNEDITYIVPSDWTPDGASVLALVFRQDRSVQIGLVSVKDGSLRVLKTTDWTAAQGLFLSPDGRHIGLDLVVGDPGSNERDVFVLAVDGSRESPAVAYPGRDLMMGWSPDGRHLLFASDRGGAPGLWSVPISDGRPAGAATLVKSDIAPASLGVSRAGSLFVVAQVGISDVRVAAIDRDEGTLTGTPTSVVRSFVGNNGGPAWSPDGKQLAYVSVRDGSGRSRVIVIRSLETGDTRELSVAMNYFGPMHWAPDGRSLLVKGNDLKGVVGLYQIDAQTGHTTRLPFEVGPCLGAPEFSPDGKKVYFFGGSDCPGRDGSFLLEGDLATGDQRELLRGRRPGQGLALSPDGRFFAHTIGEPRRTAVVLLPVNGDKSTELIRFTDGRWISALGLSWASDGRHLLVSVNTQTQGSGGNEILLVPVDGSPARTLKGDIPFPVRGAVKLHPNGRQVAFAAGEHKAEVWVLENFLPAVSARK